MLGLPGFSRLRFLSAPRLKGSLVALRAQDVEKRSKVLLGALGDVNSLQSRVNSKDQDGLEGPRLLTVDFRREAPPRGFEAEPR